MTNNCQGGNSMTIYNKIHTVELFDRAGERIITKVKCMDFQGGAS